MDQKDLQAIENLLDKKLDQKLEPIKKDIGEIKETVETHSGTLMRLEKDIKSYNEGLKLQKEKVDDHETRLAKVEETLPI